MYNVKKSILLGIDLEEFDIPEEYHHSLSNETKIKVSAEGLAALRLLLEKYKVPVTFFTTAWYALQQPDIIKSLAAANEIASHTFYHHSFASADLASSRKTLSEISGSEVVGLRLPRMRQTGYKEIAQAGYQYDSSLHPTFLPGRYNNLKKKRLPFYENGVLELPVSVTPVLRLPVFWLAFKIFPFWFYRTLCKKILKANGILILYFHPWEFSNLAGFGLPWYVKRNSGTAMIRRFDKLLKALSDMGKFSTHAHWIASGCQKD